MKGMESAALQMTWTDEELVARSVQGDYESFNQLVLRWERSLYAIAYRPLGRGQNALAAHRHKDPDGRDATDRRVLCEPRGH